MRTISLELFNILINNGMYKYCTYNQNEFITHKENLFNNMYFIVNGIVKVSCTHQNGQELILVVLNQNQIFGGIGVLQNSSSNYSFESVDEKTTIQTFSMNSIYENIKKNQDLEKDLFQIWREKHNILEERIRILNIKSTASRLIEVLVEFKEKFGYLCPKTDNIIINSPLDQGELANYIRTSRVSVNNIIQKLKCESLIDYQNQKIVLKKDFFNYYGSYQV
ncbi:Crp/Fnr family transcriptional regulator [Aquimarina sediminis]|uniref:Crp/Fnr family transcriptional regulator n=1 Tax=Aquimarina sediminis TaxID=2070536 RepID=UPI000CA06F26|nr:Crp/Fnr family transcriptional regulator [Aquimarina sediminis]